MPHELIWETEGVYWNYSGEVAGQEIIDASTKIYGDSRFDNVKYKLVNFLDIKNIEMREDQVSLIAFQHRAAEISNSSINTAIVAKPDFVLANQFAAFFKDSTWGVRVFNNMNEANHWLNRKAG